MFKKSLFKRWFKEHENKEKAVKMKKSTIIIIEVSCALVILFAAIGVKYLITNKVDNNVIKLENQVVNNITFSDFTLKYEKKTSKITVNMINYTEENIEIKKLTIRLYAKDNTKVSEIVADLQTDGNATVLGPNQRTQIENSTKLDLTDISKVEYVVE